jgi:serine/threonine-protein kinase
MPLEPGQVLNNRYRILKLLGKGGFGEVYQAWDTRLEGFCAVKRNLQPAPGVRRQFEQEARMLFKLHHANLPKVHDYFTGLQDDQYLVMEFIEGEDLCSRLNRLGSVPVDQALTWLDQICDALTYLHTRQPPVVHRDIKPANVVITPEGQAILVDFGIAKADTQMRTLSGARAWSPGFAPPEQYGQGRTDAQSDVYSLGAMAYALLTGEDPPDAMEIAVGGRKTAQPAHLVNPAVPLHVSRAIEKAMQLNREQRTLTADEFRQALRKRPKRSPEKVVPPRIDQTILEPRQQPTQAVHPPEPQPEKTPAAKATLAEISSRAKPGPETPFTDDLPKVQAFYLEEQPPLGAPIRFTIPPFLKDLDWRWIGGALVTIVVLFIVTRVLVKVLANPDAATSGNLSGRTGTSLPPDCREVGQTWTSPSDGMILLCVPAGVFTMGSDEGEYDEKPVHPVYLDAFWVDRTEITNAMFTQYASATGFSTNGSGQANPDLPAGEVSWDEASAYCQWAKRQLPSEAQWEKAARGADERMYPWGNQDPNCTLANSYDHSSSRECAGGASPVGSYPAGASPYGALDMAGNVAEWVADGYQSEYYSISPQSNPPGPENVSARVVRGGCWNNDWNFLRTSIRKESDPENRLGTVGFRCVLPGSP